jgi:hypothetical protein
VIQEVTANVIPVEFKASSSVSIAVVLSEPPKISTSEEKQASTTSASKASSNDIQDYSDDKKETSATKPSPNDPLAPQSVTPTSSTQVKTPTSSDLSTITGIPEPDWHSWGVFPWGDHPLWTGYPWGNSTIPINSCWHTGYPKEEDSPWWPGCHV